MHFDKSITHVPQLRQREWSDFPSLNLVARSGSYKKGLDIEMMSASPSLTIFFHCRQISQSADKSQICIRNLSSHGLQCLQVVILSESLSLREICINSSFLFASLIPRVKMFLFHDDRIVWWEPADISRKSKSSFSMSTFLAQSSGFIPPSM